MAQYQRIMVPLDGSELAEAALGYGTTFALTYECPLLLFRVVPPPFGNRDQAQEYLEGLAREVERLGARVQTKIVPGPGLIPSASIIAEGKAQPGTLVCMSTHGFSGVKKLILGSVTSGVLKEADFPLLITRGPSEGRQRDLAATIRTVVVPLDGNPTSEAALRYAEDTALAFGALIRLVHVAQPGQKHDEVKKSQGQIEPYLRQMQEELSRGGTLGVDVHFLQGDPLDLLIKFVESQEAPLLTMTRHSRTGLRDVFLGTFAEKVAQHATFPVLFINPEDS